jgi:hypothetical protein
VDIRLPLSDHAPPRHRLALAHERAALALGRLDAALAASKLRPGWQFRFELEAARRCAAMDGFRVEALQLAAAVNSLPLDPDTRYGSVAALVHGCFFVELMH